MLQTTGTLDTVGMPLQQQTYDKSQVQTFLATLTGADHGYIQNAGGGNERPPIVAWMRYWIDNYAGAKHFFYDADCVLCTTPWQKPQRKNWPEFPDGVCSVAPVVAATHHLLGADHRLRPGVRDDLVGCRRHVAAATVILIHPDDVERARGGHPRVAARARADGQRLGRIVPRERDLRVLPHLVIVRVALVLVESEVASAPGRRESPADRRSRSRTGSWAPSERSIPRT